MKLNVLVDIDDTLCHAWRRQEFIDEGWDVYNAKAIDDKPIQEIINLVNSFHLAGFRVIGMTARSNKYRTMTNYWLIKHGVFLDHLVMRGDLDFRADAEVKLDAAIQLFGDIEKVRENVAFIIDDREDVIKAFSGIGVTTLLIQAARCD